jgi:microsomal epoxide hydrolase
MYPYIALSGRPASAAQGKDAPPQGSPHGDEKYYVKKPFGYSWFPLELAPIPVSWVKTTGDLTWHRSHESGGHFAAMEKPDVLLEDIEDFVKSLDK